MHYVLFKNWATFLDYPNKWNFLEHAQNRAIYNCSCVSFKECTIGSWTQKTRNFYSGTQQLDNKFRAQ